MNFGIDYSSGQANIDHTNDIRYGVISQHSVTQAWVDSSVPIYPAQDGSDLDTAEPIGWQYEGDGYQLVDCLDSDVMVLKSPYYTFTMFCSPSVPGTGDLNNPVEGGVKTYCLGNDWFEDSEAPYPIYSVETGLIV